MSKKILIVLLCLPMLAWANVPQDTIRVGLLLPLHAEVMQRDKSMDRFVDFYSGALLAVYEMQATGQPVQIHTYDVGKATNQLDKVLHSGELDGMDMVIGPVYTNQVKRMSEWSLQHHVMTILPFTSEISNLISNPYLMQFNPSYAQEAETVAEYLALHGPVQCIMVEADSANIPASIRELQHGIKGYVDAYVYTTMAEIMHDSLVYYMKDDMENVLLLNTERYANLRVALPHIVNAAQKGSLTLLSQYSWQEEQIGLEQLYTTVFNQQVDTSAYERLYKHFYSCERVSTHPCYDLLGYDLMGYVLETVQTMRENHEGLSEEDILTRYYPGLQSDIQFERVGEEGGYLNRHIQCIRKK